MKNDWGGGCVGKATWNWVVTEDFLEEVIFELTRE